MPVELLKTNQNIIGIVPNTEPPQKVGGNILTIQGESATWEIRANCDKGPKTCPVLKGEMCTAQNFELIPNSPASTNHFGNVYCGKTEDGRRTIEAIKR